MTDPALLPVDRALDMVLENARPLGVQDVPLEAALGRYLGEPVVATFGLPPFTNSAMDGYALRHADAPGELELVGESAAGAPFTGVVGPGQAATISTGAVLPAGADSVAPIEWVESVTTAVDSASVRIARAVPHAYAVRQAGSDIRHGDELLPAGIRVGAGQIGAAASLGLRALRCGAVPRVAVLTTGSELQPPGEPLGPGQIYDSNGPLLRAALATAGAGVTLIPAAADTREAHRAALEQALDHDVVLSTGGVSVGGHDLVREIARELGVRELFWRIALKPGKPLSFGVRGCWPAGQQPDHRTIFFGIPGNPVSVLVCFELFVRPALAALQGARRPRPAFISSVLAAAVTQNPERDEMIRVRRHDDGSVAPLHGQESHQLALSALSDGLARIPAGSGTLAAGTAVGYLPLGVS
ncbi:MAG: molybdopterin molybdotransferase MoeA [Acidobacteriota bacterium]|nr:molybdopterin molybdotransferase MoeA [Acidobacteriota bacterium]